MKVLIVGLGSIARKHLLAINEQFANCTVYALRSGKGKQEEPGVNNIYSLSEVPEDLDFAIISNPTSEHLKTIGELAELEKPLLIEKPVLSSLEGAEELAMQLKQRNIPTYIGCNLRFHPVIQRLKEEMNHRKPVELNIYCGSYLPDWRAGQDYRIVYSARKAMGGGVHLDLIHELDYAVYLLGKPANVSSYTATKSALEIDSTDIAHYVLDYAHTSVFITVNYYRRDAKRQVECVWEDGTWTADLLKGTIITEGGEEIFREEFNILDTYHDQLRYFWESIAQGKPLMNDFSEAVEILKICLN